MVGLLRPGRQVLLGLLLTLVLVLVQVAVVALVSVGAESEVGFVWTILLVTMVGLPLPLLPVVVVVVLPFLLDVMGEVEVVPMVGLVAGSWVHQRDLAGFVCGTLALGPLLQRRR